MNIQKTIKLKDFLNSFLKGILSIRDFRKHHANYESKETLFILDKVYLEKIHYKGIKYDSKKDILLLKIIK